MKSGDYFMVRTWKRAAIVALVLIAFGGGVYAEATQQISVQVQEQTGFGFRNDQNIARKLGGMCRRLVRVGTRGRPSGASEIKVRVEIVATGGPELVALASGGIACFAAVIPR